MALPMQSNRLKLRFHTCGLPYAACKCRCCLFLLPICDGMRKFLIKAFTFAFTSIGPWTDSLNRIHIRIRIRIRIQT